MIKFNLFIISVLAVILFNVSTSVAQTTEKANIQMIIENKDSVFFIQDDMVRVDFKIKGLYSSYSTKPYKEKALQFEDIIKLSIKNKPDNYGARSCSAILKKDNYLKSLKNILNILEIEEVDFENTKISSNDFLKKSNKLKIN
jgi:hypothetical protein